MTSINRLTKQRLYADEETFNKLLPFAKYDADLGLFLHTDASLWCMFELTPQIITKASDADAFQLCQRIQEMVDSFDNTISLQVSWITTFEVDGMLHRCIREYPTSGPAGWLAHRWVNGLKKAANSGAFGRRPRKLRLVVSFRYDPPWTPRSLMENLKRTIYILMNGDPGVSAQQRRSEYRSYASTFKGIVEGAMSKLNSLGFTPRRIDGQGIIDLLYPLLNRRSTKAGKFKRGRTTRVPVPEYNPETLLSDQISETGVEHPRDGIIKKDGRVYRTVSLVQPPKQALPLMISPLLSTPFENIVTITLSKDTKANQLKRLDMLDTSLGFRERTPGGRSNQKIQTQISAVRTARQELYNNSAQLVRLGVHQTFICQTEDEAIRASSESTATFPQLNGARGMVHEISDLGVMLTSLPGCYDPLNDGPGWTVTMRSSRAVRLFPLWGNWKGSQGSLMVLPSLWNRELVNFDLYDSNIAPNVLISGVSGAGKSYLLNFILICLARGHYGRQADGQMVERPPITFVFDKGMTGQPCGFEKLAQVFQGRIYEATPSKAPSMNFLARLGQTSPDSRNEDYKDLIDICSDIIGDMASDATTHLDRMERQSVIESLVEAHRVYRSGAMKREFILSDVVAVLRAPRRVEENDESSRRRQRIAVLVGDYYGDGIYARFFDRPGALHLRERFIVFDLKALSRNPDLQRVFLKIAMLWADTVMNSPKELDTRKILVFDEAHDLIGKTSANTIETAFRLYRKRKGIVIAASQSGEDFYVGAGGQAIVQNSAHKIFLRQDPAKFHMTAKAFNLNEQQADVVLRLRTVKGVESQFYFISDIGEAALVLPLEPAYYWLSTNNGDDNQLFSDTLQKSGGDFFAALQTVVKIAPNGALAMRNPQAAALQTPEDDENSGAVSKVVGTIMQEPGNE